MPRRVQALHRAQARQTEMREQLLLFRPRSDASFASFFVSAANAPAVHALREWLRRGGGVFYLHGGIGSGRSHLLQAACRELDALYLPLADLAGYDPRQVLDGLGVGKSLCLDDIDAVSMDAAWCEQLFHVFNRCSESGTKLLVSAAQSSTQLRCALPDLQSRLGWGGNFRLQELAADDCASALQLRARERGIELSDEVVAYVLARLRRDLPALLQWLEQLDKRSLIEKKRITIPFVRRLLDTKEAEE